jgi:hypothetical protein
MPFIYKTNSDEYKRFSEDAWAEFTIPSPLPSDKVEETLTKAELSKFTSTATEYDTLCKKDAEAHLIDAGPESTDLTG